MLFSILIPVYNVERYLEECLTSVLSQDFDDYEIVLIDDGSTDLSGKICDDFKKEHMGLCTVKHKKNEGLLAARRDAFLLARGEYCICLDSDDYLSEGALSHLADMISQYHSDFILYDLYMIASNGKSQNINKDLELLTENYVYSDTQILKDSLLDLSYNNWSMAAKCIKTSIAKTGFDFQPYYDVSYGEDTIQSIILYNEASTFVYTSRRLYNYRLESGMTKKSSLKYIEDFYKIAQLMKSVCIDWSDNIDKKINMFYSLKIYQFGVNTGNSICSFMKYRLLLKEITNKKEVTAILFDSVKNFKLKHNCKERIILELILKRCYLILYSAIKMYGFIMWCIEKLNCRVKATKHNISIC